MKRVINLPELKVPFANSGETSLERRDIITPSNAFKNTKTKIDPQMYWKGRRRRRRR